MFVTIINILIILNKLYTLPEFSQNGKLTNQELFLKSLMWMLEQHQNSIMHFFFSIMFKCNTRHLLNTIEREDEGWEASYGV